MAIAEDREKFWQAEAKHLESTANNNNMSRVFSLLRQARNGQRIKTALVKDSDGNIIMTEANCLKCWKEHFSLLFQYNTTPADPTILVAANAAAPSDACSTDPVTPVEVRAALKKLNNRKAPSICAITAEMLKSGGDSIVDLLTHIFNQDLAHTCSPSHQKQPPSPAETLTGFPSPVAFASYHLTDLEYADDTILLSTSYSQLRDALDVYREESEKLGLYVSWTKAKFMHVGDGPDPPPLRFGDNIVEPVKNFVYLGSTVTDNGDLKPEILRSRALAASALQSLWRHQTISRKTKLRIYNSTVLSILLSGSGTWPLNKTLAARTDGFDSRALRTIENISESLTRRLEPAHASPEYLAWLHNAAPTGLVMSSVSLLTIRQKPSSSLTRGLETTTRQAPYPLA
ncbi:hypothetical protein QQF64_033856 [Cirrhinus molitorella]|uniref:Reverse transcriptase domain-containing protein n=1 Tax=Cirrhinus molitorella TaxID=172907 RepID=A0ABR3MV24_9TELE